MKNTFSVVLGMVLLVALCWGVYYLLTLGFSAIAGFDKSVAAAIVLACGTVIVSVITVVAGRALEQRALIEKEHRERKIPIYIELLSFLFRFLMGEKTGETPTEKDVFDFVAHFNRDFMVWGADNVLKAWVEFRKNAIVGPSENTVGSMLLLEKLIREIRLDLGHKNKNLLDGDILSLFINDVHTVLNKPTGLATKPIG